MNKYSSRYFGFFIGLLVLLGIASPIAAQQYNPHLIRADQFTDLPVVEANNNRTPAGKLIDGVLHLELELVLADFRMETPDRPGLKIYAIAEKGKAPEIPGPLVRVDEGTRIKAIIYNSHPDSIITVGGFYTRPDTSEGGTSIEPGKKANFDFIAGEAGTYLYWIDSGIRIGRSSGERQQLSGAFIIDEEGAAKDDQIMVMNIFSQRYDSTYEHGFLESLTINGLSWPHTERIKPQVGDTLRWRIINASRRSHPMHLHGFYYDVLSIGNTGTDEIYAKEDRRKVVTEFMRGRTTMLMEWTPTRPGNWVFHCHLAFHVAPEVRLPGAEEKDEHHVHMAGLVMGIEVQPGSTDLISKGENRKMDLHANEYSESSEYKFGFSFKEGVKPDSMVLATPGPILLMQQYESTEVTVHNHLSQPTGVHWHGLEIDGWADGVPNFSSSDGKMSPMIQPGESFTYKLSHMRPGTFMYHSHLNDIEQITNGLYGVLLVLPEGEPFNPKFDHPYIMQWRSPSPNNSERRELNGLKDQPDMYAKVGEEHRLRLINIAPAGNIGLRMQYEEMPYKVMAYAKDGADLPVNQQVMIERSPRLGVGETADFIFKPTKPGEYTLFVGYRDGSHNQKWIVTE